MSSEDHSYTKGGKTRKASFSLVWQWIVDAWEKIPEKMVKSFEKTGIVPNYFNMDSGSETDSEAGDTEIPAVSSELLSLFHRDTEDENFSGFSDCNF